MKKIEVEYEDFKEVKDNVHLLMTNHLPHIDMKLAVLSTKVKIIMGGMSAIAAGVLTLVIQSL